MIKLLWKFTKFILKKLSKLLGLLIVKLYLWIPISFAVIFALCSALVPFSFLEYMPHFIVLIACGTILGLLLFVKKLFGLKLINRATPTNQDETSEPKDDKSKPKILAKPKEIKHSQQNAWTQDDASAFYQEQYVSPNDIKKTLNQRRSAEWFNTTYEVAPEIDQTPSIPDLKSYSNNYDVAIEEPARLYRTRKDPSLFIAEYPDRLEYYRKTSNGMVLVSVEENSLRLQNN